MNHSRSVFWSGDSPARSANTPPITRRTAISATSLPFNRVRLAKASMALPDLGPWPMTCLGEAGAWPPLVAKHTRPAHDRRCFRRRSFAQIGALQELRVAPGLVHLAERQVAVGHLLEQRVLGRLLLEDLEPGFLERGQLLVGPAHVLDAV